MHEPGGGTRVEIVTLASGERREVLQDAGVPRLTETGHLLYRRAGAMWAIDWDLEVAGTRGAPFLVFSGVGAWYDISDNGTLVYARAEREKAPTIVSVIIHWLEELKRLAAST